MNLFRFILTILFSIFVINGISQPADLFVPYKSSDYPSDKYEVIVDSATFLKYKIEIIQLHLSPYHSNSTPNNFYCRAWLTVSENTKVISQLYFPSLEAVGGCYGFFIPKNQPRKDRFLISCFHDYEADIYFVDESGKLATLNGGTFYISNDNSLLFSNDASDLAWLTVYDLDKKVELFSDTISPYLADWYFIDGKFIATIWNYETNKIETAQFGWFDTRKKKFKILSNQKFDLLENLQLRSYNNQLPLDRCNCGR